MTPTVTSVLLTPPTTTDVSHDVHNNFNPIKTLTYPKIIKPMKSHPSSVISFNNNHLNSNLYNNMNFDTPKDNVEFNSQPHSKSRLSNKLNKNSEVNYFESNKQNMHAVQLNSNDERTHMMKNINRKPIDGTYITPLNNNYNDGFPQKITLANPKIYKVGSVVNDEFKIDLTKHITSTHNNNQYENNINAENQQYLRDQKHEKPLLDEKHLFQPNLNKTIFTMPHSNPVISPYTLSRKSNFREQNLRGTLAKHITILNAKNIPTKSQDTITFDPYLSGTKGNHVLTKEPNPYETVLLRAIDPSNKNSKHFDKNNLSRHKEKPYSALDLEHILSQIEIETELNRNLERSVQKARVKRPKAGQW